MGDSVTNCYYGLHRASGTITGRRLVFHKGTTSRFDDSGDADANDHAALVSAAQTSQAAFDTQAAYVWGAYYTALDTTDKAAARDVVAHS